LLIAAGAFALVATVFAAVYHAEVVALRVFEPFGTLVLAVIWAQLKYGDLIQV